MVNCYGNPEEKREIVRNYIRNNPKCTYKEIKKDTKIKIERIYSGMKEAYRDVGVEEPRTLIRYPKEKRKKMIIGYIKKNPKTSINDIRANLNINPLFVFDSIKDAFKAANIKYPKLRKPYGAMLKKIKNRAINFEREIIRILGKLGKVEYQVWTGRGCADAVLVINDKRYVVEIKDYKTENIGLKEARQLKKHMENLNCENGILICNFKNRDKIYIGNNEIKVITKEELLNGGVAQPGSVTDSS